MRILVADDERPARSELKNILLALLPDCQIVEATNGSDAVDQMGTAPFDLLFLDIDLGDMTGTCLAVVAQKLQPQVPIIFATAYQDHAIKAFELGATDYILKPFDPMRIQKAISRIQTTLKDNPLTSESAPPTCCDKLPVSCDKKISLLPLKEIIYIETQGRGSLIHTLQRTYSDPTSIGTLEKKLATKQFFRIHKSYLINLDHIKELFPWQKNGFAIKMCGLEKNILPVGRSQLKALRTHLDC